MDFLRQIVAGPKNRFVQNGFNLDLTYISPRIVAMAFPASGIQKLYRNSIDTIAEFLKTYHNNKYLTVNISGRQINQSVLQNVISYSWEDHKAPAFQTLFVICQTVARYLSEDPQRIAVFHCNHGKGRTGTIICCFFLFLGIFADCQSVMRYYGQKRFKREDYGVTQPCQIQYINYFNQYLINPDLYPQVLKIKKVTFRGNFSFDEPYLKILDKSGKTIYNTNSIQSSLLVQKNHQYSIVFTQKHCFAGDITLQIKENKVIGKNLLISYVFNTAFISCNTSTHIQLAELSPLGSQKQKCFIKDFTIEIQFRKVCPCGDLRKIEGCNQCKGILGEQFPRWQKIKAACQNRQSMVGRTICF